MINCQDAKHLFDRYLDGELSPSLHTELNAHRLNCTSCQSELAMLETCGSVIAMDHREPELSASFTDRVLLAQRTLVRRRSQWWMRRRVMVIGSAIAAAASIAITIMGMGLIRKSETPPRGVIAPYRVAIPKEAQHFYQSQSPTHSLSAQAQEELKNTPEMSTEGFLEALLAPVVQKSRTTLDGMGRGAEELVNVFHQGWSDTNDKLMAEYKTSQDTPQDAVPYDAQPADSYPNPDSGTDSTSDSEHVLQPL